MEIGMPVSRPKWYHSRRLLVAGLLASALSISVVAYVRSSQPRTVQFVMKHLDEIPHGPAIKAELRKAHARFEARRQGNITVAPLELTADQFDVQCYQWTGGTCRFQKCHTSRNAICQHDWGQGYSCVCSDGMCTGADGSCYAGTYEKIADGVEIKNVQWPTETVYFPRSPLMVRIGVSSSADSRDYDRKFDFYKLQCRNNGQVAIFLTTTGQPDYVAIQAQDDSLIGTVQMLKLGSSWNDPQLASTILCKASGGTSYQLGSYDVVGPGSPNYWYISKVQAMGAVNLWNFGEPGPQGEWTFDPPVDGSSLATCA